MKKNNTPGSRNQHQIGISGLVMACCSFVNNSKFFLCFPPRKVVNFRRNTQFFSDHYQNWLWVVPYHFGCNSWNQKQCFLHSLRFSRKLHISRRNFSTKKLDYHNKTIFVRSALEKCRLLLPQSLPQVRLACWPWERWISGDAKMEKLKVGR